jgi:hypothetical protein
MFPVSDFAKAGRRQTIITHVVVVARHVKNKDPGKDPGL